MSNRLYYGLVFVLFLVAVGLFLTTLPGCKRVEDKKSSPTQKIDPKKNREGCQIIRTFKTRNVTLHVSRDCFEMGSKNLHLTALFPINRSEGAARDLFWYLREAFLPGTNVQAIQRTRASKGTTHYLLVVYRLEHPKGARFR